MTNSTATKADAYEDACARSERQDRAEQAAVNSYLAACREFGDANRTVEFAPWVTDWEAVSLPVSVGTLVPKRRQTLAEVMKASLDADEVGPTMCEAMQIIINLSNGKDLEQTRKQASALIQQMAETWARETCPCQTTKKGVSNERPTFLCGLPVLPQAPLQRAGMTNLNNQIAAAQRDAGEAMVVRHLEGMGLAAPSYSSNANAKLLYRELCFADSIIKNALAIMTQEQKADWAKRNAATGCDSEGTTRANERERVLTIGKTL